VLELVIKTKIPKIRTGDVNLIVPKIYATPDKEKVDRHEKDIKEQNALYLNSKCRENVLN